MSQKASSDPYSKHMYSLCSCLSTRDSSRYTVSAFICVLVNMVTDLLLAYYPSITQLPGS